jgi:cell division protein FtsI/penicillin-binding protein 2
MTKALALALMLVPWALAAPAPSLYEQAVAQALSERFTSPQVSYLLIDAQTRTVIAARWPDAARPVPPGSLVKPLTALAYAQGHAFKYPHYLCRGTADGCWYPPGHGRIGITEAVEFSCNAYFRKLAGQVTAENLRAAMRRLGVEHAPASLAPGALIGLGGDWNLSPRELARAYLNLVAQSDDPGIAPIVRGMELSAAKGTGRAIGRALGRAALAKTGTAPCVHVPPSPGDGYVVALYPAKSPRLLLMVRQDGVPGAKAAVTAGKILRVAVDGP